jgi:hypothetical protein
MSRLEGLSALNRRLNAIQRNADLLRDIQLNAVAEAKRRVPRKTSALGRSIHPGSLGNDFAIVEATAPYAAYVELGTRPHVIKPRRKSVLSWTEGKRLSGRARTGAAAGQRFFAKRVNHPGTKPQPYLVPAARWALEKVGITKLIERWNRAA